MRSAILAAILALVAAQPAAACSCGWWNQDYNEARRTFVASVDAIVMGPVISSDPTAYEGWLAAETTLTVERWWIGGGDVPPAEVRVRHETHVFGSSCALEFPPGTRTTMMLGRHDGYFVTNYCAQLIIWDDSDDFDRAVHEYLVRQSAD